MRLVALIPLSLAAAVLVGCNNPNELRTDDGAAAGKSAALVYPAARTVDQVDTYHDVKIADPYRWLEDLDSAGTRNWVEAENALTFDFLAKIPVRDALRARVETLWNYERYSPYAHHGKYYAFQKNDGLQNQSVLYVTEKIGGEPRVLLDPNTLSSDGTVALKGSAFSSDGRYFAYGLSAAGSDWETWQVLDVDSGEPLTDKLEWVKFSTASWRKDGSGFYYSRYDEPKGDNALKAVNQFQKLYFHKLGTPQSEDALVYELPTQPDWSIGGEVSEDGRYLIISIGRGTEPKNLVLYRDLTATDAKAHELIPDWTAQFEFLGNQGGTFYFLTDEDAPRYRVIAIDTAKPARADWREVVPQAAETLQDARIVGDRIIAGYLKDAHSDVRRYALDGTALGSVDLPALGTAGGFTGHMQDQESFFVYTSFTAPPTVYRLDVRDGTTQALIQPNYPVDTSVYETRQVFYASKDGTRVPMYIVARKDIALDGNNPTILYGYGGFNISLTPAFSPSVMAWLDQGGVYALANLRGGGEYGREWHDAGTKTDKQNVFDDFAAAAQYLIAQNYTSPKRLAIRGGSNGGLLVAATMEQHPELFAAAIPAVGVLDMLRFRDFTIGKAWESDYGSVTDAEQFKAILAYSPLHNIKADVDYPASMVITGDHDDRVFPAHSYKFTAALQAVNPPRPALIRIETRAGHGQGKPTSKQIDETADVYAFILEAFGMGGKKQG